MGSLTFYFRCDGLREKPKALRSVTHPRSWMPIMSPSWVSLHELTSMSQLLWFIFTIVYGWWSWRLAGGFTWNPNGNRHSLWILESTRYFFLLYMLKLNISRFSFSFFWKTIFLQNHVRRLSLIAKNYMHCVLFKLFFLFCFLFFLCGLCFTFSLFQMLIRCFSDRKTYNHELWRGKRLIRLKKNWPTGN